MLTPEREEQMREHWNDGWFGAGTDAVGELFAELSHLRWALASQPGMTAERLAELLGTEMPKP